MNYQFTENKHFIYCDPLGYLRNEKFIVYHMVDPTDNQIRYIGQTISGIKRIVNHFTPFALKPRNHKNSWLKSLKIKGIKPIVFVAHKADSFEQLNEIEKNQITVFKKCVNLTNLRDGGATRKYLEPKPKSSFLKWSKKIAKKKGNSTPSIAVKDQYGTLYQSLSIAARQIGTTTGNIRKHLNGVHRHIKGYKFKEIQ
jgi:hypothetical protein